MTIKPSEILEKAQNLKEQYAKAMKNNYSYDSSSRIMISEKTEPQRDGIVTGAIMSTLVVGSSLVTTTFLQSAVQHLGLANLSHSEAILNSTALSTGVAALFILGSTVYNLAKKFRDDRLIDFIKKESISDFFSKYPEFNVIKDSMSQLTNSEFKKENINISQDAIDKINNATLSLNALGVKDYLVDKLDKIITNKKIDELNIQNNKNTL